ncbi:MAG: threonine--tRNA ligase [Planctomycetes bacterium]|nr:threonine--tRNA ligase [Planctomycetota bacterium]
MKRVATEGNKYKIDNAKRAVDGGAATLSWYVTGEPRRIRKASGEEFFFITAGPVTSTNTFCVPTSALQGSVLDVSKKQEHVSGDFVDQEAPHWQWEDLCMGPHVPNTGVIGAFKVTSVASSHWHGNVDSDRFQRVYGTAFFSKADLDAHLNQLDEAKQRDHRVIGQKLGLFVIDEMVGQGLVLWKPRGGMVRTLLQEFLQRELLHRGYDMVFTPHIGKIDLYKTSGHYPYYAEAQFPPIKMRDHVGGTGGDEEYILKPMNCPHHIRIYASDPHSYRDLPVRLAEFGTVYRFEQSGELSGMTRVRGFTQDDAHIFCTQDQVKHEFRATVELVQFVFDVFGFKDVSIRLSLRDPASDKYTGAPELWDQAERELREVLQEMKVSYTEAKGEAAFYGPKTDFIVKDVIGRKWQLGTVQLDYNLPERFKIEYIGADNKPHRPVMIHRAPFGSMERFMAILIEHYAGAFPLWLSPEQVRVLPISEKFTAYGQKVTQALSDAGFRVRLDESGDRVQAKIKVAQDLKVNYMLVVGGKDEAAQAVSIRCRTRGDLGAVPIQAFVDKAKNELATNGRDLVGL